MTSYIYFIQANGDGPIKIGITGLCPRKRMAKIQSDCPWPVKLIGAIHGGIDRERELHTALAQWRTSGEWFSPHADVLALIQTTISAGTQIAVPSRAEPWTPKYDHPLCIWLASNKIRAYVFAQRIGLRPNAVTRMFTDGVWISREVGRRIYEETNGEVTPNDFLYWPPPDKKLGAA